MNDYSVDPVIVPPVYPGLSGPAGASHAATTPFDEILRVTQQRPAAREKPLSATSQRATLQRDDPHTSSPRKDATQPSDDPAPAKATTAAADSSPKSTTADAEHDRPSTEDDAPESTLVAAAPPSASETSASETAASETAAIEGETAVALVAATKVVPEAESPENDIDPAVLKATARRGTARGQNVATAHEADDRQSHPAAAEHANKPVTKVAANAIDPDVLANEQGELPLTEATGTSIDAGPTDGEPSPTKPVVAEQPTVAIGKTNVAPQAAVHTDGVQTVAAAETTLAHDGDQDAAESSPRRSNDHPRRRTPAAGSFTESPATPMATRIPAAELIEAPQRAARAHDRESSDIANKPAAGPTTVAPNDDANRSTPRESVAAPGGDPSPRLKWLGGARATTTHGTSSAGGEAEVDRVRFVQRVARAFQHIGEEGGQIRLRLSPPSLGSLQIEVALRGGELTARLQTETAAAKNLLLDNLPLLRERLAQQDIKVTRFDVDLLGQHDPRQNSGHTAHDQSSTSHALTRRNALHSHGQPIPVAATSPTPASRTTLDVWI